MAQTIQVIIHYIQHHIQESILLLEDKGVIMAKLKDTYSYGQLKGLGGGRPPFRC